MPKGCRTMNASRANIPEKKDPGADSPRSSKIVLAFSRSELVLPLKDPGVVLESCYAIPFLFVTAGDDVVEDDLLTLKIPGLVAQGRNIPVET